jgi:hypothetical protein
MSIRPTINNMSGATTVSPDVAIVDI